MEKYPSMVCLCLVPQYGYVQVYILSVLCFSRKLNFYILFSGSHTCFVCKVTSVDTLRCSVSLCGKFYHLECVKKLRLAHADKHRLQCPLHACTTCTADDIKNPLASKGICWISIPIICLSFIYECFYSYVTQTRRLSLPRYWARGLNRGQEFPSLQFFNSAGVREFAISCKVVAWF